MKKMPLIALVTLAALAGSSFASTTSQPYAGQDTRDIASLSATDIDDLLAGRGWGFALAAELNGYPGPTHVLDEADALNLSAEQRSAVEAIFNEMNAAARVLGAEFVAAEAALDAAFAEKTIDPDVLVTLTTEASRIEAELRATHLAAHLRVAPLLTRHQIVTYNRLRGYGDGAADHGDHSGHGQH